LAGGWLLLLLLLLAGWYGQPKLALANDSILGQIGANMPVILKYPQIFLTRTKKVKKSG
jgi:hypothetical protein